MKSRGRSRGIRSHRSTNIVCLKQCWRRTSTMGEFGNRPTHTARSQSRQRKTLAQSRPQPKAQHCSSSFLVELQWVGWSVGQSLDRKKVRHKMSDVQSSWRCLQMIAQFSRFDRHQAKYNNITTATKSEVKLCRRNTFDPYSSELIVLLPLKYFNLWRNKYIHGKPHDLESLRRF